MIRRALQRLLTRASNAALDGEEIRLEPLTMMDAISIEHALLGRRGEHEEQLRRRVSAEIQRRWPGA